MKLLARYNRVNLIITVIVMVITGVVYYQAISMILTGQKDKDLIVEENEIFEYVELNHQLPQTFETNDQQITFYKVSPGSVKREFFNTQYFKKDTEGRHHHQHGGEYEAGRGLLTAVSVGNNYYKVLIVESKVETEDLIRIIFFITAGVTLLLLVVLQLTNRLLLSRLWQPFHNIMSELRLFNVTDTQGFSNVNTSIDEFRELNDTVADMSARVKHDYKNLKTFTENASHELLTPIAVINSKLDTLIQTENFSEQQSKILSDLYSAVSRLNRLNQSLLLLVKIENSLVHDQQQISLKTLLDDMLIQFEEIYKDKNITLIADLADKEIYGSRYLAEILLSNLISNAIRHNIEGGNIIINLSNNHLAIKNAGTDGALDEEKIFTRFHKASGSEGSGLGLTISKEICGSFGFTLAYSFNNGYHSFVVGFE